ncbi:MAG: tetratricopeptide repeat protein, partial [Gemmatimonadaceae bacterium]
FIRREGVWFCNTGGRANRGWVPITPQLALADCGDWPPARVLGDELRFSNCQSCHGSQIQVSLDSATPKYETTFSSLGINCESCHGPGRRHLALVKDAQAVASEEIGMSPLATLTKDGSLGVCWQCHALKDRLQGGFVSGKPLDAYYSVHLPQLGERAHFADGRVRTFGYQEGHLWSDCYVSGGMTCTSCHDPHSQGYRDVNGTPLAGRDDDRQCTSCHQAKGAAVEAHTRHSAASAGSRCVACHMPYLQEPEIGTALRYARSDHAIPVPRPAADAALGITSSCRGCHTDRTEQALNAQVADWYGTLKPRASAITAALELPTETDREKAAGRVLRAEEKHTAALFAGMALFAEQFLSADMPTLEREVIERLEQLSSHPNLDVRALALASLHLAAGERGAVRTFLAARLKALGADESRVRSRWTVVLGFFADRERDRGDASAGAAIYAKALEIEPDNARLHLNRGVALAQTGDYAPAVASIERSLVLNPSQPLALVNLGISRSAQGDKMGAMAAYQKALSFNVREALAWFNLGNVYFELGRESEAGAAYAKAVESDPSLPLAHFYLARALAKSGAIARALREVDAGLEFDPQNAEALGAREQLQRMLVSPPASQ